MVVCEGYFFAHFYSTELLECTLKPKEDKCFSRFDGNSVSLQDEL